MAQTLEARILLSARDEASRIFGQAGTNARHLAEKIEGLGRSFAAARAASAGLTSSLEHMAQRARNVGLLASAALTAPLVLFGKASLKAAQEAVEAEALIGQTLKSTGRQALVSKEQLGEMAKELARLSTFDDDEILKNVTKNLLRFGKIHGDVFQRAQAAVVDLAAESGNLEEAAQGLGIALQDPATATRKLRGFGVLLSAQQKQLMKHFMETGQVAKAQGIILGAVEKKYKDAAQALSGTAFGALKNFRKEWENVKEALGRREAELLEPWLRRAAELMREFALMSDAAKNSAVAIGGLAALSGPVLTFLSQAGLAVLALRVGFAGLAITAGGVAAALLPVAAAAAAIAAAVAGVAWLKGKQERGDFGPPEIFALKNALKPGILGFGAGELAGVPVDAWKQLSKLADALETGKISAEDFRREVGKVQRELKPSHEKDFLKKFLEESVKPGELDLKRLNEELERTRRLLKPSSFGWGPSAGGFPRPIPIGGGWPGQGFGGGGTTSGGPRVPGGDSGGGGRPRGLSGGPGGGVGTGPGLSGGVAPGKRSGRLGGLPGGLGGSVGTGPHFGLSGGLGPGKRATGRSVGVAPGIPGSLSERMMTAMREAQAQLLQESVPQANVRAAAAALIGNAAQEGLNPRAVHDQGTGFGIYGARNERRTNMLRWLGAHGYERDSLEGQARAMAHESMAGNPWRQFPRTRAALMAATPGGLAQTAITVSREFLAPARWAAMEGNRVRYAGQAYRLGGREPPPSSFIDHGASGPGGQSIMRKQDLGTGTLGVNISIDGPGKVTGVRPQSSGNLEFGNIAVDRLGRRFERPSGLR